jgi:PAS domain S-box-containing protein
MDTNSLLEQLKVLEQERDLANERFDLLVQATGQIIYIYDVPTGRLNWFGATESILGYSLDSLGTTIEQWLALIHPEDVDWANKMLAEAEKKVEPYRVEYRFQRKDGAYLWMFDQGFFKADKAGKAYQMIGALQDISNLKRAEAERIQQQAELINNQELQLRELSTPLIPISDHAVVMPIVGSVDVRRGQQILETLLEGIAQHQADVAILDITGMAVVDTGVANGLLQATHAARLLGAHVMITGISPEVAQTLVGLGIDLSEIETLARLQDGISKALEL